jgi:DNA-binding NarL/FixJ family response regulator
MSRQTGLIFGLVIVQSLCGLYLLWEILSSLFGLPEIPLRWEWREGVEVAVILALILGAAASARLGVLAQKEIARAQSAHALTAGQFTREVEKHFAQFSLTPAETEIAWFLIKGMSIADIAALRGTREGTIRAQATVIYRKSGVKGKTQFLSQVVEDLLL